MKRKNIKGGLKSRLQAIVKKRKTEEDDYPSSEEEDFEVSAEQFRKNEEKEKEEFRVKDASELVEEKEEELSAAEKRVLNAQKFLDNLKSYEGVYLCDVNFNSECQ